MVSEFTWQLIGALHDLEETLVVGIFYTSWEPQTSPQWPIFFLTVRFSRLLEIVYQRHLVASRRNNSFFIRLEPHSIFNDSVSRFLLCSCILTQTECGHMFFLTSLSLTYIFPYKAFFWLFLADWKANCPSTTANFRTKKKFSREEIREKTGGSLSLWVGSLSKTYTREGLRSKIRYWPRFNLVCSCPILVSSVKRILL